MCEDLRRVGEHPRPVLKFLGTELSDVTNYISVGAMVEERYPIMWSNFSRSEMVSGKKVINVRDPRDATFENMTCLIP